ncbi:MAG TPA: signal peptidase II [Bryobacteraceae bacterium]|nr:signal peptidase II [Bryobacteraceae bacterium]
MIYRLAPFAIAGAIFILDRLSKWLIKTHVSLWETHRIIPGFFNIIHTENPGVAFGLFADSTGPLRSLILIGLSAGVLVLITWVLLRSPRDERPSWILRIGLALVLGGAMGNLFDRVVRGTVTDFVEIYADDHYFPAFNVADSGITVGAALLIIDMWRGREKQRPQIETPH